MLYLKQRLLGGWDAVVTMPGLLSSWVSLYSFGFVVVGSRVLKSLHSGFVGKGLAAKGVSPHSTQSKTSTRSA